MHGKTYTIPARDVVPGMLVVGNTGSRAPHHDGPWTVTKYELRDRLAQMRKPSGWWFSVRPRTLLDVSLPGPSPRELLPDIADRLRVWPAPLVDLSWRWDDDSDDPGWWAGDDFVSMSEVHHNFCDGMRADPCRYRECFFLANEHKP